MSTDGQRTKWRRNIEENFNYLSRVHERYRQTTDGRTGDVITLQRSLKVFSFRGGEGLRLRTNWRSAPKQGLCPKTLLVLGLRLTRPSSTTDNFWIRPVGL